MIGMYDFFSFKHYCALNEWNFLVSPFAIVSMRKRVRATMFWGLPWAFPLNTVNSSRLSNRITAIFPNCRLFCFNVKSFDSDSFFKNALLL